MVKDTRKTTGTGDIRPLNQPIALPVKADGDGLPIALKLRGRWLNVESVDDRWRMEDEWWREQPVSRIYYECVVDGRIRVTVFQDIVAERWYRQRT